MPTFAPRFHECNISPATPCPAARFPVDSPRAGVGLGQRRNQVGSEFQSRARSCPLMIYVIAHLGCPLCCLFSPTRGRVRAVACFVPTHCRAWMCRVPHAHPCCYVVSHLCRPGRPQIALLHFQLTRYLAKLATLATMQDCVACARLLLRVFWYAQAKGCACFGMQRGRECMLATFCLCAAAHLRTRKRAGDFALTIHPHPQLTHAAHPS